MNPSLRGTICRPDARELKHMIRRRLTHVAEGLLGQQRGDGGVWRGPLVRRAAGRQHPVLAVRQVDGAGRAGAQRAGAVVPAAASQPLICGWE